jgi:cell division protease FtsH
MNVSQRNFWLFALMVLGLIFAYNIFENDTVKKNSALLDYSEFKQAASQKHIKSVVMQGDTIAGSTTDGVPFITKIPDNIQVADELATQGIKVTAADRNEGQSLLLSAFLSILPTLLFFGVMVYFYRQMQVGANKAMGFGRSKAKLMEEQEVKVTFKDVAGIDEALDELKEIVDFLKDPKKFQRLGGRIPRGVLLMGAPGTGKTLLARSIAGEAGVPFFSISGSDFVEMFVGVGASRVRDMFEQGKKSAPCIMFIDEIDAVGRHRGSGHGGGNDEREQTLNQLLVEMDGFDENQGIIVIAATNRPDVLDPALLRPGRFDRQVVVPLPDVGGREKILTVHLQKVPQASDIDVAVIARGTPGFSGADLANLVNEAALLAARKGRRVVGLPELEEAKDKVMMGAERRSMVMSEEEKKITAYHEAGHALVGVHLPDSDPIHKATIIPRGRALGMVMRLPERDRVSYTLAKIQADLAVAMGGRVAEEMTFGATKVTTGASSDISAATNLARRMVTEWGMSEKMGPLNYRGDDHENFLGYMGGQSREISDETAKFIDQEVARIVNGGYETAQKILTKNKKQLELLAQALLEFETLTGDEIKEIIAGKKLERAKEQLPKKKSSSFGLEEAPAKPKPKKKKAKE